MLTALFPWLLTAAVAPPAYVLQGQLTGVPAGTTIYLTHYQSGWQTLDSATVDAAGHCELRGQLADPILASLKVSGQKVIYQLPLHPGDQLSFTLEQEPQKQFLRFKARGSVGVEQWQQFQQDIYPQMFGVAQLPAKNRGLRELRALVRRTPDTFLAAYLTKNYLSRQASQQAFVDSMTTVLAQRQPALAEAQALATRTHTAALTEKGGEPAPDFTLPTATGPSFTLSSLRGKYVLVDFWASWCGPCRAENPRLRTLYQQYQAKGLEIVSVSVDADGGKWRKAVGQDQLPWTQVPDLKGWDSPAAQLYGVLAVPTTVLIAPDGLILSRNLRGEALEKRLSKLLP
ncbi:TlpA disulfide reductase family protein [Hymenobacter swuensis]|uniref:Peroxiredoxin n=1 Tax=Hymenobacter swuensis DY53 TaxID=1227739 RepID=W8F5L6_9BACT|nr:TlpA disulfide reductase family protein [Hymenobacter swuensis]AHJ97896.1 peroxiredoxin [Hymenobacter swuensis DY53]